MDHALTGRVLFLVHPKLTAFEVDVLEVQFGHFARAQSSKKLNGHTCPQVDACGQEKSFRLRRAEVAYYRLPFIGTLDAVHGICLGPSTFNREGERR